MNIRNFFSRLPKLRLLVLIALICLGIIFILGFIPLSFPVVKQTIEKRVSGFASGDTLSIEELTFTLWRGFSLSNIKYATVGKKRPAVKMQLPRALISYRMIPLIWGKFVVDKIILRKPLGEVKLLRP